ncbi:MAG: UDP-N-acetylglucosamine--N-acetylmuramyl-(pentapeptide) pyrophosphoryl-undecaprenol N-acetylglucosamine transferase [Ignavibacteria bacterium]|nr:UDP-N-acetylglucosamine--N-acetylmuramyl-(pentapeptide) pyrophosphoryl-undecaprenol N-acetylglucosamine transferase [Ignavibacteria bacterium]
MKKLKTLFISGSLGLGHIYRDTAIANQLRKLLPEIEIEWLAANPATTILINAGEKLVPDTEKYANENISAEKTAKGSSLNLSKYLLKSRSEWKKNTDFFLNLITSKKYDIVIGDETYEINLALRKHPDIKKFLFVTIYDFVGLDAMTLNPLERLGVYYWNRVWSRDYRLKQKPPYDLALFVGELEDVPNITFGFMLPNRRDFAKSLYTFIGYVFPFEPSNYSNKLKIRNKLGYGNEPLLLCSLGGTAIGKELLELCGKAYLIAKQQITNLKALFITGPRLSRDSVNLPEETEIKGFVPNLFEHFAACDLAIVQGGATSTLELTALRRPFIYFPLENHCEQANVSRILSKRGAGVKLDLSKTTSEMLADQILKLIGANVTYPDIPKDGAQKAAQYIVKLLNELS